MRPRLVIPLLLLLVSSALYAKDKKPQVPAAFRNATYVYVESPDGDELRPGLYPGDREAIGDVEDALRDWKRYTLTTRRSEAELVIVVRKGRVANARVGVIAAGQSYPPNQTPNRGPSSGPGSGPGSGPASGPASGPGVGVGAQAGPEDDMLRVYMLSPDNKLEGPIWDRSMTDGLDAPQLPLFKQLKAAVEKAYPPTTASQKTKP